LLWPQQIRFGGSRFYMRRQALRASSDRLPVLRRGGGSDLRARLGKPTFYFYLLLLVPET
jgi:hypothetical protein